MTQNKVVIHEYTKQIDTFESKKNTFRVIEYNYYIVNEDTGLKLINTTFGRIDDAIMYCDHHKIPYSLGNTITT